MSKKPQRLKQENPSLLYILPIAFVISVVPLIVFLKVVNLSPIEIKNWYGQPTYTDFFNYYKSQWLIIGTVFAIIFYLIHGLTKGFNFQKSFLYIPTGIYALLIILSTVFSKNPQVALRGFVARYEGMFALLCYLALMLIVYNLVRTEKQIKFILGALLISASIVGIIGLFQFFGLDLFRSAFGKQLILPEAYHKAAESINFRFDEGAVYSTFANTNYVGSYVALVMPLVFISIFYFDKLWLKLGSATLAIILLISLIGSGSRAGFVGLGVSIVLAVIVFRKVIFKRKLIALIVIISIFGVFFGVDLLLNNALIKKIESEFAEPKIGQFFDLKDINFEKNTVSIVDGLETLTIKTDINSKLNFYDTTNDRLESSERTDNQGILDIRLNDSRYKNYIFKIKDNIITVIQRKMEFKLRIIDGTFRFIGLNGDETSLIEKPDVLGLIGYERLGSSRGYIWTRTIPLLNAAIILGYGPDTFAIVFPQKDYIGKLRAFGSSQMLVDKPHNMYLQMAINSGFVSLLAILILYGFYIIQSITLYFRNMENNFLNLSGSFIFIALCGYIVTGFFNDSIVGIAPIFWIVLGLGIICNTIVKEKRSLLTLAK